MLRTQLLFPKGSILMKTVNWKAPFKAVLIQGLLGKLYSAKYSRQVLIFCFIPLVKVRVGFYTPEFFVLIVTVFTNNPLIESFFEIDL